MKPDPLVSIVVPVHNGERHLCECLNSVLGQSLQSHELIVVDDCSSDRTGEICAAYQNRDNFVYLLNETNLGTARARNRGIKHARGTYVAFLDGDDRWYPNLLSTQMEIFAKHDEVHCLCSDFDIIDEHGQTTFNTEAPRQYDGHARLNRHNLDGIWEGTQNLIPSTFIARKSALQEVGLFSDVFAEDINLWLKLTASGFDIHETPAALASYRRHETQKTSDGYKMVLARCMAYELAVKQYPVIKTKVGSKRFHSQMHGLNKSAANYYFWIRQDYDLALKHLRACASHQFLDIDAHLKMVWCLTPGWLRHTIRRIKSVRHSNIHNA